MPPAPQITPEAESTTAPGQETNFAKLPQNNKKVVYFRLILFFVVIIGGIATAFLISRSRGVVSQGGVTQINSPDKKEVGLNDEKTFDTCAKGTLEVNEGNGKKTDGTHHLIREGGPSQTLYIVSSVVTLDNYLGKNVEVCGQTLNSKTVPWFMDVGKLKII